MRGNPADCGVIGRGVCQECGVWGFVLAVYADSPDSGVHAWRCYLCRPKGIKRTARVIETESRVNERIRRDGTLARVKAAYA